LPSHTSKQVKFMRAESDRKRKGKKTQTGMSESQLEDFTKLDRRKKKKKS